MKFYLHKVLLLFFLTGVVSDLTCGPGQITVLMAGQSTCILCNNETAYYYADSGSYQASCLSNIDAVYCAALDTDSTCQSCPAGTSVNSESLSASSLTDCICNEYTFGPAGGPCSSCPDGSLCTGGVLTTCPAGSFCVDGMEIACPEGTSSGYGASSVQQCNLCDDGYYYGNDNLCHLCPANSYCSSNAIAGECVDGAVSDAGSTSASDCSCSTVSFPFFNFLIFCFIFFIIFYLFIFLFFFPGNLFGLWRGM